MGFIKILSDIFFSPIIFIDSVNHEFMNGYDKFVCHILNNVNIVASSIDNIPLLSIF